MFLRHDLMRVSGDAADADRFLVSHHESEAMADAYAARLIAAERWDELIGFIDMVARETTLGPTPVVLLGSTGSIGTQAREVIELSVGAQKQIIDALQQLAARGEAAA